MSGAPGRKPPVRVECSGGCGKSQTTRHPTAPWEAVGCGGCEGWRALEAAEVPDGMVRVLGFNAVGGFHAMRLRIATAGERAAVARARRALGAASF